MIVTSRLHGWYPNPNLIENIQHRELYTWLTCPDSMTQRIKTFSGKPLAVKIIQEGWGNAEQSETTLLELAPRAKVWIREVYLCSEDKPWIYGRSIFPSNILQGKLRYLLHIADNPLGNYLYHLHKTTREPMQYAKITMDSPLYQSAIQSIPEPSDSLWARRSLLNLDQHRFLLNEIYLPDCINALITTEVV